MNDGSSFRLVANKKEFEKFRGKLPLNFFKHFSSRAEFVGIIKGEEVVSLCAYKIREDGKLDVKFLWTNPKPSLVISFKKQFGVTPSRAIKEKFIREGIRSFVTIKYGQKGPRLIEKLEKEGLFAKIGSGKILLKKSTMGEERIVTPKWVAQAKLRKRILI
jgi:hypothetical protein